MIEVGETIAHGGRIAWIECDDLFGRQLRVPAQGLEDTEYVVVGDQCLSADRRRLRARAVLSCGWRFHGWKGERQALAFVNVRHVALCVGLRQSATACLSIKYYHAVAGCRGAPRSVATCRGATFSRLYVAKL